MTTNISKQKREDLLNKINDIRTFITSAPQDENTRNLLSYLFDLEKAVNGQKYGIVFEEHREEIDEILTTHTPILTEEKELYVDHGGQLHFLIEGDNLASLKLLEKTHKGAIDVIYIDPPYNTGAKNWKYNNDYVDGTDTFKHSKWLSFMDRRLRLANKLLSDSGVIVLTIDDYEVENITLLMNNIFGEDHRLGTVVIKNNPQGRSSVTGLQISHEYALFYGKKNAKIGRLPRNEEQLARYKERDEIGPFEWRNFRAQYSTESPKMAYPIFVKKDCSDFRIPQLRWDEEKKEYELLEQPCADELITLPQDESGRMRNWKWSISTVKEQKETEMGVRKDRSGNPTVYFKGRMKDLDMLPYTFWDNPAYSASTFGANLLSDLIGKGKFNYPKSLYAVIDSLKVANAHKNSTVLDFFAGSGTTAHAVLELNKADGGNRRFIMCTNNENGICKEVTYERIRTAIEREGYPASLKYYKVDYVPISDRLYYEYADELLGHIRELVELENGVNLTDNTEIAIVLSEEELADFIENTELFSKCKKLYMGHDLLPTEEQETALHECGIDIRVISDYYYRDLQEGSLWN